MSLKGFKNYIAVEPISLDAKVQVTNTTWGAYSNRFEDLVALKVIAGNQAGTIQPGDVVYVDPSSTALGEFRKIYEIEGKKFILVSEDIVKLVKSLFSQVMG